jgi:hypothetical protein
MKLQIFAGTTALVLAIAMTSGAMASGHRGAGGHHWRHGHRFVSGYGGQDGGPSYGGRYYSLGPLGFTSVPPGSYSSYGTPVNAWSR